MAAKQNVIADTRQLLLTAAGAVFAEHGYRATTVRAICRRAGANVAAVTYHFGDKAGLYLEVLRQAHSHALAKYPLGPGAEPSGSLEEQLHAFVHSFLLRILETGPSAHLGKLLAMEMINPGPALDTLVEERFRPMSRQVETIVAGLLGSGATPEQIRWCGSSVVSQCLFYVHCRSVMARLYPEQSFQAEDLKRLAEHITRFSLAALRGLAQSAGRKTTSPCPASTPRAKAPPRAS